MHESPFDGIKLRQEAGPCRVVINVIVDDIDTVEHGAFVVFSEIVLLQMIDAVEERARLLRAPCLRLNGGEFSLHRLLCGARHADLRHKKRGAKSRAHDFFQEHGSSSFITNMDFHTK